MSAAAPLAWCRLYADFPANYKVASLPEHMQARLVKCWCLHAAGHLVGAPIERLAFELRLPVDDVQQTLDTLIKAGLLEADRTPHNWDRRQHKSDRSVERQAAYRQRQRHGRDVSVTSPSRHGDGEGDAQSRAEQSRTEQSRTEQSPLPRDASKPRTPAQDIPYEEIISHLNQKAGSAYRATTKATQTHIRARWNEGYRLEDFQAVIDDRVSRWRHKPDMAGYLRPETLFGPKFEGYLQAARSANRAAAGADDDLPDIADLMAQEAAHG